MAYRNLSLTVVGLFGIFLFVPSCKELTTQTDGAAGGGKEGWWDAAWPYRTRITFQNAGGETLTDFPLMVRLDASRFQGSKISSNGADLRFIASDGQTILPHEIEAWNSAGDSFVWVKVPIIDAANSDHIWVYSGNLMAKDAQDSKLVWTDFIGVYHLAANDGGAPPQFADSTATMPGTWMKTPGMSVPGRIGNATQFNGVGFIQMGENSTVAANPGNTRMIEAWVKPSLSNQQQVAVYAEGQCVGWYLGTSLNGDYVGSFITDAMAPFCADGTTEYLASTPASMIETWRYLTLLIDRPQGTMELFVDGVPMSMTTIDNAGIADGNGMFQIGSDDTGAKTFVGTMDEVRVSSRPRSTGWIAAQYKSMTDQFLTFQID